MRKQYVNSRFVVAEDDWPPYQPKHYTTLALIHHEDRTDVEVISVTQELATKGDISRLSPTCAKTCRRDISDIFAFVTPTLSPRMLLIEGAPGIGKTVLSKEIAFQWATNKLLNSVKFLLLIILRNFHSGNVKSIASFMKHVFKSGKVAKDVGDYLFKSNGKDLAIVLDGYDEISEKDRTDSFVADIIKRVVFPECLLVITSRPTASSHLHSIVNCRVEVVGFTEEDRLEYIKAAIPDSNEKVKALQLYLQSNPTINALCYIPLNMTILLCLSVKGIKNLPKTQTELYERFIEMTVIRFIQKRDDKTIAANIDLLDLPHPHSEVFEELSHLAFKALQNDQLVFTLAELKTSCPNLTRSPNNWNGLGLLQSVKYFNYNTSKEDLTYHFLHFSIQEYMAAYYISKLLDSKQIRLLKNTFWTIRYYNMWIMYVGITGGRNFAMKHFFSGNWFQLFTRLVKHPGVSKKLTSDKVKCLHMFQCLAETNNIDMISSVGQCFHNQEIDLSNQTMLPNHLVTLDFFLVRSFCKQWKMLDLSRCNIGNNGCKVLSERLTARVHNATRNLVSVKKVNFSYNHFNLKSLVKLFVVLKCWNVSELIVTDNALLDSATSSKLYSEIEHNFIQSTSMRTLKLACIGTFLFAYKIDHENIEISAVNIKSMYLVNCDMKLCVSEQDCFGKQLQSLKSVHFLGTLLDITTISSILCTNNTIDHLLVYDSVLPDSASNEMCNLIWSMTPRGIMLVISESKIQGIINTHSLCSDLSDLEILNLIVKMRSLHSDCMSTVTSWREDLQFYGGKGENIIYSFSEFLHHLQSASICKLKIKLIEGNTFIAHKIGFEDIINMVTCNGSLSTIYLSSCSLTDHEFAEIVSNSFCRQSSSSISLLNSHLKCDTLCESLVHFNKMRSIFLHTTSCYLSEDDLSFMMSANSVVLLTSNVLTVHNPTNEQLALAHQLESFTICKFYHCRFDAEIFYLILTMLTVSQNVWVELDFTGCNIRHIDYEIMHEFIQGNNCEVKVKKLIIPAWQLTDISFNTCTLTKFILGLNIKELVISESNYTFVNSLIKNLQETLFKRCSQRTVILSVLCNSRKACFFCNIDWKEITSLVGEDITSFVAISCNLAPLTKDDAILMFRKMPILSQMILVNNALLEAAVSAIFELFRNKRVELSILNMIYTSGALYNLTDRSMFYKSKFSFIVTTENVLCGYNITKQQRLYLKSFSEQYSAHKITTLIHKIKYGIEKELFLIQMHQLKAICFINKLNQDVDSANFASVCDNISTLTTFGIVNYIITHKNISFLRDTIMNNTTLENLYLNSCFQCSNSLVAILKVLQGFSNLKVLEITYNNITDQEADDIATVLMCNRKLKVLNLNGNNLQAIGIIKVAKSLKNLSLLSKLFISNNNISEEAAGDIADVLSCNLNLQEIDLSDNYLLTSGAIKIAEALNTTSTLIALNLSNNKITEEATDAIAAIVSCNSNLQTLYLDGSTVQIQKIADSLKHTFTLTELSISNNITVEEAADNIAEALSHNTQLRKLNLNGNNLQDNGVIAVAKGLQNSCHLQKLELAYNSISEEAANVMADALSCKTQLYKLNLNGNNIQAVSVKKIMGALDKVSSLTKIYFNDNSVTEKATDSVATIVSHSPKLRVLSLNGNDLQATGIIQIARALINNGGSLTELYINNNNITDEAADSIASLLFHNKYLQKLELDENYLRDTGAKKVAWALLYVTTLTHLCFSYNNITDNAAGDLAAALSHNTKLQVLRLNGNHLQAKGVILIAKGLRYVSTLQCLEMECCNSTEEAADDLAAVLSYNTNIQVLNLSGNNLKGKGVIKIMKSLQNTCSLCSLALGYNDCKEEAADDIAVVISHNVKLQALYLGGNNLQTTGAKLLSKSLVHISSLTKLYLESNNITKEAADDIASILSCNIKLQEVNLRENEFQAGGITKIARALQNISSLTKLCFANNTITEEAADDIATVLSCNTNLQVLDLGNNILQAIGAQKITRRLTCISVLTELCINNNQINHERIADDLATIISCNKQLKVLDLTKNSLTTTGVIKIAKALQNNKNLLSLKMGYTRFCWEAAGDIAGIISCNTKLEELDLGGNCLGSIGTKIIAKALSDIVTLKKLYIDNTNIADEAAIDVTGILSNNRKLKVFVISENYLSATSVEKIVIGLKYSLTLTKIYISKNHISEVAAHCIAEVMLQNTGLEEVNFHDTDLQTKNAITIAKALSKTSKLTTLNLSCNNICEEAADDIAAVIYCNTRLQLLNLNCNNLQTVGIVKIAKALQNISALRQLGIEYNNFTEESVDDIAAALSHNTQLQELIISGNDLRATGTIKLAQVLETLPITKLFIGHSNLNKETADKISSILSHNANLLLYIEFT